MSGKKLKKPLCLICASASAAGAESAQKSKIIKQLCRAVRKSTYNSKPPCTEMYTAVMILFAFIIHHCGYVASHHFCGFGAYHAFTFRVAGQMNYFLTLSFLFRLGECVEEILR